MFGPPPLLSPPQALRSPSLRVGSASPGILGDTRRCSGAHAWIGSLIRHWREDPGAAYRTWFLWEQHIKNLRSIRRGLQAVVEEIKGDTFGNTYHSSSLETVVHAIAEQRQVFKGADHAFLWKPKLSNVFLVAPANTRATFGPNSPVPPSPA